MRFLTIMGLWLGVGLSLFAQPNLETGILLVAKEALNGSSFHQSVILITRYDTAKGAMGITLNRPTPLSLEDVFPELKPPLATHKMFAGGPVDPLTVSLLVYSEDNPDLIAVKKNLFFDIGLKPLRNYLEKRNPREQFRVYSGYAGWYPGQLEAEIEKGAWMIVPAQKNWIFNEAPGDVWPRLMQLWSGTWL